MAIIKEDIKKILPEWIKVIIRYVNKKLSELTEYPIIKLQTRLHKKALERVIRKVNREEKIKVAFFALHSSVWKYEEVYKLFENDERFEAIVVVCPVVNYGKENMLYEMDNAYSFFKEKGHNVVRTYNEETDEYLDVKQEINPDIVFYTNPYKGLIDDRYFITEFRDRLTCYVPYAFYTANFNEIWFDSLFQNLVWKIYYETQSHVEMAKNYARNKGVNSIYSGYPGVDSFMYGLRVEDQKTWKNQNIKLKRIIWAPHHSIEDNGLITYSNFLKLHDTMLDIAAEYNCKLQIAFKPHPLLKVKLYNHKEWGKEKTDIYYSKWEHGSNTQLESNQYVDLFNTSDALILDSGSFATEYLYCGKPSLFIISSNEVYNQFNEFGKTVLNQHYHAYTKTDIYEFVDNVCSGCDKAKEQRSKYYYQYLIPPNDISASRNIYKDINNEIFVDIL